MWKGTKVSLAMKNEGGKLMIHSYIKENNECIINNTCIQIC